MRPSTRENANADRAARPWLIKRFVGADAAFLLLATGTAVLAMGMQSASRQGPLSLQRAVELPRVEGRIDHLALDSAGEKLFVAALGNNTVEVVDVKNGTHRESIPGLREPQGIAVASEANLVVVANGQGEGVQFLDLGDYRMGKAVSLGEDSDNVRYDRTAKRLYVGYGSGALAAINPADGQVLGTVKLAGHPESFQLEAAGSRIFVNVPSARHIAVVDRNGMKVLSTWPVTEAGSNYPMALDDIGHQVFVGCRKPAKVLAFDTANGKPIASADIVGDTDDMFIDAQRHRLYVIGGEGFIDVLDISAPRKLTRIARIPTAAGARTGLFAPAQGQLFLAVPHRGAQKAEIRIYDTRD